MRNYYGNLVTAQFVKIAEGSQSDEIAGGYDKIKAFTKIVISFTYEKQKKLKLMIFRFCIE